MKKVVLVFVLTLLCAVHAAAQTEDLKRWELQATERHDRSRQLGHRARARQDRR